MRLEDTPCQEWIASTQGRRFGSIERTRWDVTFDLDLVQISLFFLGKPTYDGPLCSGNPLQKVYALKPTSE